MEVGGVYPSPTSRAFQAGCRHAADRLGFAVPCPDERRIATPTVQGTRALLVACPEPGQASSYGGSVRLRWKSRGTLAVVDLTGFSEVNQRLAVTLAERSPLVPPRR